MVNKKDWIDLTAYSLVDKFKECLDKAWDNGRLEGMKIGAETYRKYNRGDVAKSKSNNNIIYLYIIESLDDFVGAYMKDGSYVIVPKSEITYINKTYNNIKNFFADYEDK